jgi:hypothetical protein
MSSVSNAVSLGQMEIAVARKQLDSMEQEGKDAVKLIEAAAPPQVEGAPPANTAAGVGTQLNVTA